MKKNIFFLPFIFILFLGALYTSLQRLGWQLPAIPIDLINHGPLMITGFLGTLISLERATALNKRWIFFAPILIAAGSFLALTPSLKELGILILTAGSLVNFLGMVYLTYLQNQLFNKTMALGALIYFLGNVFLTAGYSFSPVILFWMGFLIVTILGERLELTRMLPVSRTHIIIFQILITIFSASIFYSIFSLQTASIVFSVCLILLAIWFSFNDIIKKTIKLSGQTRFTAVGLVFGYFWSIAGSLIILKYDFQKAGFIYDAFLHSIFLGFVFSMIFVHAPIVFSAVFRQPVKYSGRFYIHLVLLQITIAGRIYADIASDASLRMFFGLGNVLSILLMILNTLISVIQGKKE
ncbi:MAG: hypothetical protein OEZ13_06860 [Spirochaetia bacterium]|nr:hypothetical protein [Spirochaetia bacterium]